MFNNIFSQGDYSIYMLYIHQPQRSRGDDQLLLRRFRSLSFCVHKNKSPERLTKAKAPLACSPRPDMSKQTGAKRSKTQLSRRDCCVLLERLDVRDDSPKRKSVRCGDTTPNAIGERIAVHNVNGCNLQTLNSPAIISLSQDMAFLIPAVFKASVEGAADATPVIDLDATIRARGQQHMVSLSNTGREAEVAVFLLSVFPEGSVVSKDGTGTYSSPLMKLGSITLYAAHTTSAQCLGNILDACVPTPQKCIEVLHFLINRGLSRSKVQSIAEWEERVTALIKSFGATTPDLCIGKD